MAELARSDRAARGRLLVESSQDAGDVWLTVYGEIDVANVAEELERSLAAARELGPKRIVVDLDGLSFMDSTGLHALLLARRDARSVGCEIALARVPEHAMAVLRVTGVLRFFAIVE